MQPQRRLDTLDRIELGLEQEGYDKGTPLYEVEYRRRRVAHCQMMQGVSSCHGCPIFDSCEMAKAHLRDVRYGIPK